MGRTHGIMQAKRLVPLSPQLTDARLALDHQRFNSKILQSRRQFETRLATPNDDHDRLLVRPFALALPTPLFRPRPVLRFLLPQRTGELRYAMQTLQVRENRVGLPFPVRRGNEAQDARCRSHGGREREKCLDPRHVRVRRPQSCGFGVELEIRDFGDRQAIEEELFDAIAAKEGAEVPCESEDVAPESVVHQLADDTVHVVSLDTVRKRFKPLLSYGSRVHFGGRRKPQPF